MLQFFNVINTFTALYKQPLSEETAEAIRTEAPVRPDIGPDFSYYDFPSLVPRIFEKYPGNPERGPLIIF